MSEIGIKVTDYKILVMICDKAFVEKTVQKIYTPTEVNVYVDRTFYLKQECQKEIEDLLGACLQTVNSEEKCMEIKASLLYYFDKKISMDELFFEGQFFDREKFCLFFVKDENYDLV